MSKYVSDINTRCSVNNAQTLPEVFKSWVGENFKVGDCFVTLTFKPTIKFDESSRSADIKRFLQRLNRIIFGKAFDYGHKKLNSCPVFELNYSDGVHVHMLLERPEANIRFDGDFDKLIIDTWYSMKNAGIKKAQDVRTCFDVNGALGYMSKQMRTGNKFIWLDANNLNWQ